MQNYTKTNLKTKIVKNKNTKTTEKMPTAYHYTTEKTYEKILSEGALKPMSPMFCGGTKARGLALPEGLFTFAFLDTPEPETWKNQGLIDRLKLKLRAKATGEVNFFMQFISRPFNYVVLSFPLERSTEVTVLDGLSLMVKDGERREDGILRYLASATPLSQYNNEYDGPELAVPYNIPAEKLTLEKRVASRTLGLY